jgi:hypothetical protein
MHVGVILILFSQNKTCFASMFLRTVDSSTLILILYVSMISEKKEQDCVDMQNFSVVV